MSDIKVQHLRDDLSAAGFTVEALDRLWGSEASESLHRGQRVPAVRALEQDDTALGTLARLFILGLEVSEAAAQAALPSLGISGAIQLGLATRSASDNVRPLLDLRPYSFVDSLGGQNWWIVSDLGELALGHPLRDDHVLGIGGASLTLSGLIIQNPVDRVLDLGTGCGIQAMHASRHAREVVATDISERALALASLNAELNEIVTIDFRLGSLFEPVSGEQFDQIISNPPFVITPRDAGVPLYEYRDGGMVGDDLVRDVVENAADYLVPGGIAQLLGNWEYHRPEAAGEESKATGEASGATGEAGRANGDGLRRVTAWLESPAAAVLDVWVIERDLQNAPEYAETWIRDGGTKPGTAEFDRLYRIWLDDFAARGIRSVGFGYILLRKAPDGDSERTAPRYPRLLRVETLHGALGYNETGLGAHLATCLTAHDWQVRQDDASLGAARLVVADDVTEERHYWPGDEDPTELLLHQGGGFGRTLSIDTALAAFVGACDGELRVDAIASALAELLSVDRDTLTTQFYGQVRRLVDDAILLPATE